MLRPTLDDFRNRDLVGPLLMFSPILLWTLYLYLSDSWPWRYTDVAALVVVMAVGLAGVWQLPISRVARALAFPAYAIFVVILAVFSAISFRGGL